MYLKPTHVHVTPENGLIPPYLAFEQTYKNAIWNSKNLETCRNMKAETRETENGFEVWNGENGQLQAVAAFEIGRINGSLCLGLVAVNGRKLATKEQVYQVLTAAQLKSISPHIKHLNH